MLSLITHFTVKNRFRACAFATLAMLLTMNLTPAAGAEIQRGEIVPDSIRTTDCNLHVKAKSKNISLTISEEDKLFWNLTPVPDFEELLRKAKQISPMEPQPEVRLCADRKVKYQQIGRTLIVLQRAGIAKVSYIIGDQTVTLDLPIRPPPSMSMTRVVNVIFFDFDGIMSLNGSPVEDFAQVTRELRRIAADPAKPTLILKPDRLSEYRSVTDVLVLSHQLGIDKIEFVGNAQYLGTSSKSDSSGNVSASHSVERPAVNSSNVNTNSQQDDTNLLHSSAPQFFDLTDCKPEYPRASLLSEEEGTVQIIFAIDADAKLIDAKIVKSSGYPNLDDATITALSKCKFRAAIVDGQPRAASFPAMWVWKLH